MTHWLLVVSGQYAIWKKERGRSVCLASTPGVCWMVGAPAEAVKKYLVSRRVEWEWVIEDAEGEDLLNSSQGPKADRLGKRN